MLCKRRVKWCWRTQSLPSFTKNWYVSSPSWCYLHRCYSPLPSAISPFVGDWRKVWSCWKHTAQSHGRWWLLLSVHLIVAIIILEGYFDDYTSRQLIRATWTNIPYPMMTSSQCIAEGPLTPDMRGGHQMCIDSDAGQLFLYGGWNGSKEVGDLWQFTIASNKWTCLSLDTSQQVSFYHHGVKVTGYCLLISFAQARKQLWPEISVSHLLASLAGLILPLDLRMFSILKPIFVPYSQLLKPC